MGALDPLVIDAEQRVVAGLRLLREVGVGGVDLLHELVEMVGAELGPQARDEAGLARVRRVEMGEGEERLPAQIRPEELQQREIPVADDFLDRVEQRLRLRGLDDLPELGRVVARLDRGAVGDEREGEGVARHQPLRRPAVRAEQVPACAGAGEEQQDNDNQRQPAKYGHR